MATRKTQALSLLEGILDETAQEAEAARLALDAELKRNQDAARSAAEAAETARRTEIALRLQEEEARQLAAAERRTATLEALRVEDLRAQGLWVDPEPEPVAAPIVAPVQSAEPFVEERRSGGFFAAGFFAAAAALLVLGGATVGGYLHATQQFVDSSTSFVSVPPVLVAVADTRAAVDFRPIPVPAVLAEEEEERGGEARDRGGDRERDPGNNDAAAEPTEPTRRHLPLGDNLRVGDR